jgi:heat shock protein HspQ
MIMIKRQEGRGEGAAAFEPGQLVRHRRYGYRGVVVALDPACRAPDAWYQSNSTQPSKALPWYLVLVDHSSQSTYAAEENLVADASGEPIAHPLVDEFFERFEGGAYHRNARPWR